ncbi:hypothetical protein ACFOLF_33220 [Paenibacillus sepulcri]
MNKLQAAKSTIRRKRHYEESEHKEVDHGCQRGCDVGWGAR